MWDNTVAKRNPKAPDYKCRDRSCDGLYWPGQWQAELARRAQPGLPFAAAVDAELAGGRSPLDDDELPF